LNSLKNQLQDFPKSTQHGSKQPIWEIPDKLNPFSKLTYVVTNSEKEWKDQILELSTVIIDRLNKRNLRKVAQCLGKDDPAIGSLKLLRVCLQGLNVDSEVIDNIMIPLETLWLLRSNGVAHFGKTPKDIDFREHFKELLMSIDYAMKLLAELVQEKYFDIGKDNKLSKEKV